MPWHYRDARDLRTKFADHPEVVAESYQRHGLWRPRHVAIHDAILQTLVLKDVLAYERSVLEGVAIITRHRPASSTPDLGLPIR